MYPDDECPDQILKYPQRHAGNQSLWLLYCEILSCASVALWCWIGLSYVLFSFECFIISSCFSIFPFHQFGCQFTHFSLFSLSWFWICVALQARPLFDKHVFLLWFWGISGFCLQDFVKWWRIHPGENQFKSQELTKPRSSLFDVLQKRTIVISTAAISSCLTSLVSSSGFVKVMFEHIYWFEFLLLYYKIYKI